MSTFERYLSLWVALCIVAGIVLGNLFPGVFEIVSSWEYASVNAIQQSVSGFQEVSPCQKSGQGYEKEVQSRY